MEFLQSETALIANRPDEIRSSHQIKGWQQWHLRTNADRVETVFKLKLSHNSSNKTQNDFVLEVMQIEM